MPDKTSIPFPYLPELDPTIKEAYLNDELVLFIGSGLSRRLDAYGWEGFADSIFEQLASSKKTDVNHNLLNQIKHYSPRKKLSFALELADGKIDLNFRKALNVVSNEVSNHSLHVYDYLNQLQCNIVTTNYDTFLHKEPNDESLILPSSTGENSEAIAKREPIYRRSEIHENTLDKEKLKIIHLHGCLGYNSNEDLVITTSDYLKLYQPKDDNNILKFLRSLFNDGPWTILFIGYGLDEMEILEYLLRQDSKDQKNKNIEKDTIIDRFWVEGFYTHQQEEFKLLKRYYRKNFNVKIVPFCLDKNRYSQLDVVIKDWVKKLEVEKHSAPENVVSLVRKINENG